MSRKHQQAYEFIARFGPVSATRIANHLNIGTDSFYARYVKVLRNKGVLNSEGGYFIPNEGVSES